MIFVYIDRPISPFEGGRGDVLYTDVLYTDVLYTDVLYTDVHIKGGCYLISTLKLL